MSPFLPSQREREAGVLGLHPGVRGDDVPGRGPGLVPSRPRPQDRLREDTDTDTDTPGSRGTADSPAPPDPFALSPSHLLPPTDRSDDDSCFSSEGETAVPFGVPRARGTPTPGWPLSGTAAQGSLRARASRASPRGPLRQPAPQRDGSAREDVSRATWSRAAGTPLLCPSGPGTGALRTEPPPPLPGPAAREGLTFPDLPEGDPEWAGGAVRGEKVS